MKENMTLTLESVQTICERMFSDKMLQIERKIQLMFEKLLNKHGSTADVPDPATETPSKVATVENGLVVLQKCQIPLQRKDRSATGSRHQHNIIQSIRILLNTQQWRRTTEINVGFSAGALATLATIAVAAVAGQLRPDPTCTTRASGHGTGQQLSTYYLYTPSFHQACTTSPPTLATPIHLQQRQL
jgi:hypothetical protein